MAELSRLTAGTLTGGENALFVTGVTGDNLTVTDVLALRSGRLQNIALGAGRESGTRGGNFPRPFPAR